MLAPGSVKAHAPITDRHLQQSYEAIEGIQQDDVFSCESYWLPYPLLKAINADLERISPSSPRTSRERYCTWVCTSCSLSRSAGLGYPLGRLSGTLRARLAIGNEQICGIAAGNIQDDHWGS
jgi:hypothetical protein